MDQPMAVTPMAVTPITAKRRATSADLGHVAHWSLDARRQNRGAVAFVRCLDFKPIANSCYASEMRQI